MSHEQGEQRTLHKNKALRSPHGRYGTGERARQVTPVLRPYGREKRAREDRTEFSSLANITIKSAATANLLNTYNTQLRRQLHELLPRNGVPTRNNAVYGALFVRVRASCVSIPALSNNEFPLRNGEGTRAASERKCGRGGRGVSLTGCGDGEGRGTYPC